MYNIFTFGFGQKHQNHYIGIHAQDEAACRIKMMNLFGKEWCAQYPDKEAAGVKRFDLKELKIEPYTCEKCSRGGMAFAAMTHWNCEVCNDRGLAGSSDTPTICDVCSHLKKECTKCRCKQPELCN